MYYSTMLGIHNYSNRAIQKQIDSGKEREKKMEVGMIELDRKLSEATQTIVRRTREMAQ